MPNPDLLPTGRSFPTAPPPPLDGIVNRARRRRRIRAGVAGGLSAGVAVVAVLLLTPGASPGSLKVVTPAVGPTASSSASPTPSRGTVGSAQRPSSKAPASSVHPGTVAATGASAPAAQQSPPPEGPAVIGPPHRVVSYDPSRGCNGSGPTAANGWCSYYDGVTSGTSGRTVELATAVCRLPSAGAGTLVSDDGREADFDVGVARYPASWTWSHGYRFVPGSRSLTVAAGSCIEWYVSWNVVDDAGHPLRPGTYYLDATPLAQDPNTTASAVADNPAQFTVR